MVAPRRLAVSRRAAGEEVAAGAVELRPGGGEPGGEVERDCEPYKARAAASSASKSGTSFEP